MDSEDWLTKAESRGLFKIKNGKIRYRLARPKEFDYSHPEEKVRAKLVAYLSLNLGYSPARIDLETQVPRRTPSDFADIVLYADDERRRPYLVVECKAPSRAESIDAQFIEQLFGNANSLRAELGLVTDGNTSLLFDIAGFGASERSRNRIGNLNQVPPHYGTPPMFRLVAGESGDIAPASSQGLARVLRRAHSIIWAGGKRDPLTAFDEWSKLLLAKAQDERGTPNGKPREFQVGAHESETAVANRVRELFRSAARVDPSIFTPDVELALPDRKIASVVEVLQDISITDTSADTIGTAFEGFFGGIFRGELGQYFTMRTIARFVVAALEIDRDDFVIDPTCGSGGFLLEVLLQVWNRIDGEFSGRKELERLKSDFALKHVYGIEIHEVLARICKINLLAHHDGHTNIEGDRSCLDSTFSTGRLRKWNGAFSCIVGNPPFGDNVKEADEDLLGGNKLSNFALGSGKKSAHSEHLILERAIQFLEPGGRLGFVLPDGIFNNSGERSGCPDARALLMSTGRVLAIVSLPDHAFRKSGAQNKTSVLLFRKFTGEEKARFESAIHDSIQSRREDRIADAVARNDYSVFLAEAEEIGYTASGIASDRNDLFKQSKEGKLLSDQSMTVLGSYRRFADEREDFESQDQPSCLSLLASEVWRAHPTHRLDPKFHLFKSDEKRTIPTGWIRAPIRELLTRRAERVKPEENPEELVTVLTLSQDGSLRARESGKGKNPPEWRGLYFAEMPSEWFAVRCGDIVFSSIDLWKGCISRVTSEFDGALVTKEFPVYEVSDPRVSSSFLARLLRTDYYMRAFRAITTGHSNRRRTQPADFEDLEIFFPASIDEQERLIKDILDQERARDEAASLVAEANARFSSVIS
ncbi:MAG: hypothetical protein CMJ94_12010 [Planctomycetes bacterium]|nr:hypothetical protein [Planctomycetota bacterium]